MTQSRLAAARVLLALEAGRTTLAAELERARRGLADERDRALLGELAAGVLRWRTALDAALSPHSHLPLAGLSSPVRTVLRLAAYQLGHLDRVPPHAVVHESVELTRVLGQPRAAGFVNAVLRRLAEGKRPGAGEQRPAPGAGRRAHLAYLTTTLSHPEWLATRWLDRHGFDAAAAWCAFNNQIPAVSARVLGTQPVAEVLEALNAAGVKASPGAWVERAIRLDSGASGRIAELVAGGVPVFVQDEASQIVAETVGARPGERVLDVAAAPGGKTLVMAQALSDRGLLVAADHRPSRARLLRTTTRRADRPVAVVRLDARRPLPFGPVFDRVLLDAPCSGLGTVGRDPDLKWSRRAEDLPRFAADQRELLAQAADAVRPGGVLVYATCSSEPEENDDVVASFLADRPDFAHRPAEPGPGVPRGSALVDPAGFLRTLPFRDQLDAFFAAVLVRRSPT